VSAGILELGHALGLGSGVAGTSVYSGASLVLHPLMVTTEALTLSGLARRMASGRARALYLSHKVMLLGSV